MATKRKTTAYRKLKNDMLANLTARGLIEAIYTDKVDEYMDFWEQLQQLRSDINERGISVFDSKRGMYVENRSIALSVQISRQMLAIYQALGFRDQALAAEMSGDDDDDL